MKRTNPPIEVAIVGTGYFGAGLLRRLHMLDGFVPRVAVNRTLSRALAAFERAGIDADRVVVARDVAHARSALDEGCYVASTDPLLPIELSDIDVVVDATGHLLVGTEVAHAALQAGKHVVAANSDVQATLGPVLRQLADRAGVVYSDIEGDEPGLLKGLIEYCAEIGLEVVVAGNGKGVVKRYATPETQAAYAAEYGIQPWLATAAADGTKLNFELTVTANACGMTPSVHGMHGPATDLDHVVEVYGRLGLLDGGGPYVDYVLGVRGVFVIVKSDDPCVRSDFGYLKMGDGPYYVLHQPHVLAQYAAPRGIARAVRQGLATVTPSLTPTAETVAYAKRDLPAGHRLDGVGGFDTYGLIANAREASQERFVPVGIAQYARLRRPVRKDTPISYDFVEFDSDNLALELRRQQDVLFPAA